VQKLYNVRFDDDLLHMTPKAGNKRKIGKLDFMKNFKFVHQKTLSAGNMSQVVKHLPGKCKVPEFKHRYHHHQKKKKEDTIYRVKR
jgi:hypothetical protein